MLEGFLIPTKLKNTNEEHEMGNDSFNTVDTVYVDSRDDYDGSDLKDRIISAS